VVVMQEQNLTTPKEPWLAVVLSSFLAGVGQIYSGRLRRGCVLIFIEAALTSCATWFIFSLTGRIIIGAGFILLLGIVHIWNLFDAYKRIKSFCVGSATQKLLILFVEAIRMVRLSCMSPTLIEGDRFFVRKFGKYSPKRGDIVVFKSPNDPNTPYVMRAAGFGGEIIEIKDKSIYIDSEKVKSPPFQSIEYVSMGQFGVEGKAFVIPAKSFFVLGDYSSKSFDSRFYGAIPESGLIGKAYKIYWPPSRMGPIR